MPSPRRMGLFPDATNRQRAAGRPERSIGRGEAAEASRTRPGTRPWTRTDDGRESGVRIWLELRAIAAGAGSTLAKPGSGGTTSRLAALADWAARDLSLARLVEGHGDAVGTL